MFNNNKLVCLSMSTTFNLLENLQASKEATRVEPIVWYDPKMLE
jgi:hypothetical protein